PHAAACRIRTDGDLGGAGQGTGRRLPSAGAEGPGPASVANGPRPRQSALERRRCEVPRAAPNPLSRAGNRTGGDPGSGDRQPGPVGAAKRPAGTGSNPPGGSRPSGADAEGGFVARPSAPKATPVPPWSAGRDRAARRQRSKGRAERTQPRGRGTPIADPRPQ